MIESQIAIAEVCDDIKQLLLKKNEQYGDSALNPARILSKSSPTEQILVRIDDKLNRIIQGDILEDDEDVVSDLIGYLVLLKVALKKQQDNPYNRSKSRPNNVPLTRHSINTEKLQHNQSKYFDQTWKDAYFNECDEKHPGQG